MRDKTVLEVLANAIIARGNCEKTGNAEWSEKHTETIEQIIKDFFPYGSGFDSGCKIDLNTSDEKRIDIDTSFHHMNDGGYYDGWTDHRITVRPSFVGFDLKISGKDQNEIKEHIAQCFDISLSEAVIFDGSKYVSKK